MCYTVEHNVFVDRTGIINNVRGEHNSSSTRSPNPNPADALGPAAGESTFLFHFFRTSLGSAAKTQVTSQLSQIKAHKVLEKIARETSWQRGRRGRKSERSGK